MERLLVALGLALVIGSIALFIGRRRRIDAPTGGQGVVPAQLDRGDFARPEAPWLVALFTSATCEACADVRAKAEVLASDDVVVDAIEYPSRRDLHHRYGIEAVPLVVIVGADGAVLTYFLGPVTATDLWNAMSAARGGSAA